jgi:intracellular sulfur oxidation DsrE/DsrF family protein
MGVRTYVNGKVIQSQTVTALKKAVLVEATVTTGDTVPIIELTSIDTVACFNATTGLAITATELTNVVTITEVGLTSVKIFILAIGA